MRNNLSASLALALLAALNTPLATVHAQGTAFTYQGLLRDTAGPASGTYDFQFTVRDALTGGNPVGLNPLAATLEVSNGLFAATLDPGPGVFTGAARWLEIAVRTNGAALFTTLSPRQPITATPYAITAGAVTGPVNGALITAGSITGTQLAAGAVTATNIASNSITATQLAAGAAAQNLNAGGQSGVASGGLVLSATENAALVNAGYIRISGTITTADAWQQRASPAGRHYHTAVWTGAAR